MKCHDTKVMQFHYDEIEMIAKSYPDF